jgi:FMN phosphatase YigB (HAD superfamily)
LESKYHFQTSKMASRLLDQSLDPYSVIAFDCGGVLHSTSFSDPKDKESRDLVVQEMIDLEPLLLRLSKKHILVLVCNSNKKKIFDLILRSKLGRYFTKMYIAPNKSPKVPRLEKVMKDFQTNQIILLDDKMRNINEAMENGISSLQITYEDLIYFV